MLILQSMTTLIRRMQLKIKKISIKMEARKRAFIKQDIARNLKRSSGIPKDPSLKLMSRAI